MRCVRARWRRSVRSLSVCTTAALIPRLSSLFLQAATHARTGDYALIRELWPAIERALEWIDGPGDIDGDGFVEYLRGASTGLSNQGWKDSFDSVFHATVGWPKAPSRWWRCRDTSMRPRSSLRIAGASLV